MTTSTEQKIEPEVRAAASADRWWAPSALRARAVDGGWGSFAVFSFVAISVLLFTLVTVNRHGEAYLANANISARTMGWFTAWRTRGFFRYAGLLVYPEEGMKVYKTHTGMYLWLPYLLHRVVRGLTGGNGFRALAIFFQLLIAFNAAVIGLLGMRIARRIGAGAEHALLLGISAAAVFQTFPINLAGFFALNPGTLVVLFSTPFWILVDDGALASTGTLRQRRMVAACMLLLTVSHSIAMALFFVVSLALAAALLAPNMVRARPFLRYVAFPLVPAMAFHQLQLLWVRLTMPKTEFTGNLNYSDFLWRSGLDGSTEFYTSPLDVLSRRWMSMGYINPDPVTARATEPMMTWKWLFIAGSLSVLINGIWLVRSPRSRSAVLFLAGATGCYLLSLFVFSQGVVIHPDCWDVLIAFPLIVSLFALLPAHLAASPRSTGLAVLVTVIAALCYSFVQLRAYAVTFPVPVG